MTRKFSGKVVLDFSPAWGKIVLCAPLTKAVTELIRAIYETNPHLFDVQEVMELTISVDQRTLRARARANNDPENPLSPDSN